MKQFLTSLFAVAALVTLSAAAYAAPGQPAAPAAKASAHARWTPEQREAIHKVFAAHRDKLHQLRTDYWAKKTELRALAASGKAEKSDIQGLVADMKTLRDARYEERKAIASELEAGGVKGFHFRHHFAMRGHARADRAWS
jgi:Spy/CpxP family protein refolding chaperone